MNRRVNDSAALAAPPKPATPQSCTNFRLHRLARQLGQHYDAELRKTGLKTSQYSLLSHVERLGPMRPVDLAAAMGVTASTLSRNLQVLVQHGWIAQQPGADSRSRLVRVTPAGSAKRAEAQRHWKAAQLALNARLGDAHVSALHALIDETSALLAETGQSDDAGDPQGPGADADG